MEESEGRSLEETPTWAVATVITVLVGIGFLIHSCLKRLGKLLNKTKRKPLLAALEKIKDELMLFGLLSLLMGHWTIFVAKICVKSSGLSTHFFHVHPRKLSRGELFVSHILTLRNENTNASISSQLVENGEQHGFCPEGQESFASYESLEQLHRFLFVLGTTHVLYSFVAIALAVVKVNDLCLITVISLQSTEFLFAILAHRSTTGEHGENHAMSMALQESLGLELFIVIYTALLDLQQASRRMTHLTSFVFHHTSHPWSSHRILVWLLCFSRQFWSSISHADYKALRLGFITTHQLPLTYNFHQYMLRSMEEEFDIFIPLWIFTILCILLEFHGTNVYFWISFFPAMLIILIGTKLHRVVVKLAVEIMDASPHTGFFQFNLRDELFWFGKPRLLLHLIQFITFQNAFEMATYIWSLWIMKGPSCFTDNRTFLIVRLTFGLVSQFWCSFITFPLYVIVAQMGSKYKKSIVSESVRKSLHGWRNKARSKQESSSVAPTNTLSNMSSDSLKDENNRDEDKITLWKLLSLDSLEQYQPNEITTCDEEHQCLPCADSENGVNVDAYNSGINRNQSNEDAEDGSHIVPLKLQN